MNKKLSNADKLPAEQHDSLNNQEISAIPTKFDLEFKCSASRYPSVEEVVARITADIIEAMRAGESSIYLLRYMPDRQARAKLESNFRARGWHLSYHPGRREGVYIHWK